MRCIGIKVLYSEAKKAAGDKNVLDVKVPQKQEGGNTPHYFTIRYLMDL